MAASVDTLSIQITASTKAAKNNIDALADSLATLSSAIGALDVSKFDDLAASAKNLSEGLSGIKGVSARHIESVAKALRKVAAESKETSACTALVVRNFQALSEVSSGFSNGMNQGANSVENMSAASENVGGSLSVINQNMNELATTGSKLAEIFEEVVGTMSRMQSVLGGGQTGQLFIEDLNNAEVIDTTFREIEDAVENTANGFRQLAIEAKEAAQGEEEFIDGFQKFNASPLEDINAAMERVSNSVKNASSGMSWFKNMLAGMKVIIPTDSLDALNKKISNLVEKAQELQDRMNYKMSNDSSYKGSPELERDQKRIKGLISEIDRLMLKKQELESHGGFRLNFEGFSNVAKSISKANDKLKSFTSHLFRAKSASRDTAKSTDNFSLSANKLAKELLRVSKMLKLMVTRMALRAIIKEVGNGFKSLALHSAEFDNAMSGLINASKQLGYSFAGMVSPLINALAPALVYIINLAIKAVNVFNQLFSILSGKDTWNKAKSFTGKWSDEIKDANKQAKELKKTVLGFDELNQLQEKYTSGGDTSGNIEDMFETVKTEQKWQDFIDKLVNPLKQAWAKVGDEVMAAWKRAFENIKKLGSDVARDFWKVWQQPETQKIFEDILKIVRDIGDFVANITEQLDKAWNKNEVGLHILEKMRDIIGIIVAGIQRITESWADWAATIDFYPLLSAIDEFLESLKKPAEAIMGIFEDLNKDFIQPLAKWLIEDGIPELIKVFTRFNDEVKWDKIRERLDRIWKILAKLTPKVGEGLVKFIGEVSEKVAGFLNSKGWDSFIDTLENWTDRIDSDDICDALEGIANALIAYKAITFLGTVATGIKTFAAALGGLGTVVSGLGGILFLAEIAGVIYEVKKSIEDWNAFVDKSGGFKDAFANRREYADMKSSNPYLNGTVSQGVQDVANAWTKMQENNKLRRKQDGDDVARWADETAKKFHEWQENNAKDLQANKEAVGQWADNAAKKFKEWQDANAENLAASKKAIGDWADETAKKFKEWQENNSKNREADRESTYKWVDDTSKKISEWVGNITETFTHLKGHIEMKIGEIQTAIKKKIAEIKEDVQDIIKQIKGFFSLDNWTFSGVIDGLKKTFGDALDGVKRLWDKFADRINGEHEIGEGTLNIHLPKFYAKGGFPDPEDGWFRASHGEMLGKFDNGQSVVANNQQITEGIARAVYSAMMSANSGNGGNVPVYTTIQIGEEEVARAVTRGQRKIDRRYSPTTT